MEDETKEGDEHSEKESERVVVPYYIKGKMYYYYLNSEETQNKTTNHEN